MILDASVTIALRSSRDPHAEAARALIVDAGDLVIHPVTLAETLVAPARVGIAAEVRDRLVDGLGIRVWEPDSDEPLRIAELRAATRVALPDCYVLGLAETAEMPMATFDARLAAEARTRGVAVVSSLI